MIGSQQTFADKLGLLVKGITEAVPIKNLTFIMDACRWLFQCHKVTKLVCHVTSVHVDHYMLFML